MELKIIDGDYVPDGCGGFQRVSGSEELLQRALHKLTAPRGRYPLAPEYGSRLYLLPRRRPSEREAAALAYAAQALDGETEIAVESVILSYEGDSQLRLGVMLELRGEKYEVEVVV